MKFLFILALSSLFTPTTDWNTDFKKATDTAKAEHKLIVLNFSGSDWCGPCIKMHKDIFDAAAFTAYADTHLILVNADFPRLRKHQLTTEQQKQNDALAEKYNKQGIFPLTLLLNSDGKIMKQWEGLPHLSPEAFTNEIKTIVDATPQP